jgi:hypothetical protein
LTLPAGDCITVADCTGTYAKITDTCVCDSAGTHPNWEAYAAIPTN